MNQDELDRRLDDELRAAFAPPPPAQLAAMARAAATPRGRALRRWPWAVLTMAAMAALAALAFLLFGPLSRLRCADDAGDSLGRAWVAAYHRAEQQGFGGSCCAPGLDIGAACQDRFSCCLGVTSGGSLAVVGGFAGDAPPDCMALLARDGELPLCVFVMRKANDRAVRLPQGSDLHLARRELGELVLYAVADAPAERALAQFVLP